MSGTEKIILAHWPSEKYLLGRSVLGEDPSCVLHPVFKDFPFAGPKNSLRFFWLESWNHRMAWVGRELQISSSPTPPAMGRVIFH